MKEEIIRIDEAHLKPTRLIVDCILKEVKFSDKYILTVGGESGSGKSTLAHAIRSVLAEHDIRSSVLHMDDYFKLPPYTNHAQREKNINRVGMEEVNLSMLQDHIDLFKDKCVSIEKPLVRYKANQIISEEIHLADVQVLIVEGTYVSILENINRKIFMSRNYKETFEARKKRNRDLIIPFNEEVLEIEHKIIVLHESYADILVGQNYKIENRIIYSD